MLNKARKFFAGAKLKSSRLLILIFCGFCALISAEAQGAARSKPGDPKNLFPIFRECFTNQLEIKQPPQIASDNVNLFIFSNGKVYSFQKNNLKLNWINYLGGDAVSNFQIVGRKLFIVSKISQTKQDDQNEENRRESETKTAANSASESKHILWTIDAESGLTVNRGELPASEKYYLQNFRGRLSLENSDGLIIFFDERGTPENTYETGSSITLPPIINGQEIYIISQTRLFSINFTGGKDHEYVEKIDEKKINNIYIFPEVINALSIDGGGKFWAGGDRGTIYALDGTRRELIWKYRTGARINDLKPGGDRILAASADGFLYSFNALKGSLKWKKRLENQIAGQTHLAGGRIILQITDQNSIKSIDLKTGGLINNDDFRTVLAKDFDESNILYSVESLESSGNLILIESGGLFYFSAETCPGHN